MGSSDIPNRGGFLRTGDLPTIIESVKCDIKSQTMEELQEQFQQWECPTYRVTQLLDWLYRRKVISWEAMSNLPKNIRQNLEHTFSLETLQLARKQGSRHDPEIPLAAFRWRFHRKRPHSRQPRPVRRSERSPHALCFHPGRLRLWLSFLRERTGRLEAQPRRARNCGAGPGGRTLECRRAWRGKVL
jgi:hypothetical protein